MRKALGADAIVGAFARASRHEGLTAGEIGADYVSFGPVGATGLGDGTTAPLELFEWWSEMIEVPVVAEGGLTPDLAAALAAVADFLALGDEIWTAPDGARRRSPLRRAGSPERDPVLARLAAVLHASAWQVGSTAAASRGSNGAAQPPDRRVGRLGQRLAVGEVGERQRRVEGHARPRRRSSAPARRGGGSAKSISPHQP